MFSVWTWRLVSLGRKLWLRAALYALLGVATALVAALADRLPLGDAGFGAASVETILTILASSMLAVTTFSLGIMVSALAGAAQTATPRAVALLMQDGTTQTVLATFLGAFLFSLVALIALKAGIYGAAGRMVLFLVTLAMVAAIVLTMLRWIAHLSAFGRMGDVLARVEAAAGAALAARLAAPYLGGHPRQGALPAGAVPVFPATAGYVQHLDTGALQAAAEAAGVQVHVADLPGAFADPGGPLCWLSAPVEDTGPFARAFTLGSVRQFDQDPRFGLQVLAEIASRALSPAVNDPGTAIDVLGRAVRLLGPWAKRREVALVHPRLWVPEIRVQDLFEDVFRPVARDGAALVEVQIRLQKALIALARLDPGDFTRAAARQSAEALARAEAVLVVEADREVLRALNATLAAPGAGGRPPGI